MTRLERDGTAPWGTTNYSAQNALVRRCIIAIPEESIGSELYCCVKGILWMPFSEAHVPAKTYCMCYSGQSLCLRTCMCYSGQGLCLRTCLGGETLESNYLGELYRSLSPITNMLHFGGQYTCQTKEWGLHVYINIYGWTFPFAILLMFPSVWCVQFSWLLSHTWAKQSTRKEV